MKKVKITTIFILIVILIFTSNVTTLAEESDTNQNEIINSSEENQIELYDTNTQYFDNVKKVKTDSGYSKELEINNDDPHFGWKLGKFAINGFSSKTKDDDGNWVFLKNVGDNITLFFNLEQDINKLGGNSDLSIAEDKKGYDKEFGIKQTNFGRGYLIIRKTDASGDKQAPVLYQDYLDGVKVGANTKVDVFEEGDYEVALDYEIKESRKVAFINDYDSYKIRFNFKVRNGNCMIFPMDVDTNSELKTTSVVKNGFYLDLAQSKYLDIIIKKETYTEGADGLVEDTRFNRPARQGEKYTEEGIYTITAKNKYTNEETTKKIYVGSNKVIKAYMKTGYSIKQINDMVKNYGASIDDDGNLDNIPQEYKEQENKQKETTSNESSKIGIIVTLFVVLVSAIILIIKNINDNKFINKKIEENKEKINNNVNKSSSNTILDQNIIENEDELKNSVAEHEDQHDENDGEEDKSDSEEP